MHMHYVELCFNETARTSYLHSYQGTASSSGSIINNYDASTPGHGLLDFSCRSVDVIKVWINTFLSLPPDECAGLSFIHMAQLARCLVVLYRLSTFAHPAWDCLLVRNTVDLLSVLDSVAEKLELASREAGEQSPDDLFMRLSGMMRKFRINAAATMGPKAGVADDTGWVNDGEVNGAGVGGEAAVLHDQTLLQSMSSGDDTFLESVFGQFGGAWSP
ncbi:MAG: hypothetical protein M1822_005711 [Bathelium mastoideum]|nr:MAG: hypothetical protein M1822_005711 [Bathelium mastoideum]